MNTHSASARGVVYAGVDVCAQWLDIHGLNGAKITWPPNTAAGHVQLIGGLPAGAHVVLEASGGYAQALWLALLRADRPRFAMCPIRDETGAAEARSFK